MDKPLYELLESGASDEEILASIAAGANVEERKPITAEDNPMVTPLQIAVKQRRSETIIRALLESGADIEASWCDEDDMVDAGLEWDDFIGNFEYRSWYAPQTPLCIALFNKDLAMIELLGKLGANADAEYTIDYGQTIRELAQASIEEEGADELDRKIWQAIKNI